MEFVVLEDTVEVASSTENEKRGDVAQAVSSVRTDALEQTNAAEESFEIEVEAVPCLDDFTTTPPKTIEVKEPGAPSLIRITSVGSLSTPGTKGKMNSPTSPSDQKSMPTPIDLTKKLTDGNDNNNLSPSITAMLQEKVAPFISTVTLCFQFFVGLIQKRLIAAFQSNPALFTAFFCGMLTFMLHLVTISGVNSFDRVAVLGNPDVIGTRSIFPHLFTHDFWGDDMALGGNHKSYRPLAVMSLRFTNFSAGTESAAGFHIDNVTLHAFATIIHSLICFQLLGTFIKNKRFATMSAVLASIIFAVHPIHTEPVASIVGELFRVFQSKAM
jgi:hypothetical protein